MKRAFGWRMAGVVVVMTAMMATAAQAQQPSVVLSIRGIEEVLDDVDFVGGEAGKEGLKEQAEGLLNAFTGGKGLAGVDQKKPLGLYLNITTGSELPVVFIPVSDAADFQGLISALVPDFKDNKGLWTFSVSGQPMTAKIVNGYCFISANPSALGKLPDPAKIVNSKYDLALDLSLASIPDSLKDNFLALTEQGGRQAMQSSPDPANKAEEVGREFGFNGMLAIFKSIAKDGDRAIIGIDVNDDTRLAAVDISLTAKANTELSKSMASFGKTTPLFAGLGAESAPFRLVASYPTTGIIESVDKLLDGIKDTAYEEIKKSDQLDSDDDKETAKGFVNRILDIIKATNKTGSSHSGLVLEPAKEGKLRFIAGAKVAKGEDVAKLIEEILTLAKDNPDAGEVKLDAAKAGGARIHAINPKNDDEAEKYFGDEPIHLAARPDSVWVSLGADNLAALKKALDQFGKPSSAKAPAPISILIKPAALVLLMEKDNEDLIESAKEVAGKPGDKLSLEVVPVASGAKLRLEWGVDLLGLLPQDD